jgi:hypothetical protein
MHDALECIRKEATKHIQLYLKTTNKILASIKKAHNKQRRSKPPKTDVDAPLLVPEPPVFPVQQEVTPLLLPLPWGCEMSVEEILKQLPVVVLGDMNCDPCDFSAPHALLLYGEATARGVVMPMGDSSSSSSSSLSLSSSCKLKVKKQLLGNFVDAYDFAYSSGNSAQSSSISAELSTGAPPTMICEHLYGVITDEITSPLADNNNNYNNEVEVEVRHELSAMALESIFGMFSKFASMSKHPSSPLSPPLSPAVKEYVMSTSDVKKWLETINLASNRGSEMRAALASMVMLTPVCLLGDEVGESGSDILIAKEELREFPPEEAGAYLDWNGFRSIYEQSINEGM